jgi:hypothetical protein
VSWDSISSRLVTLGAIAANEPRPKAFTFLKRKGVNTAEGDSEKET